MFEKQYLTVEEARKFLGISRPTIYKMIRERKIGAINTGRKYLIDRETLKVKTPHNEGPKIKGV